LIRENKMTRYDSQKLNGDVTADIEVVPKEQKTEHVSINFKMAVWVLCTSVLTVLYYFFKFVGKLKMFMLKQFVFPLTNQLICSSFYCIRLN